MKIATRRRLRRLRLPLWAGAILLGAASAAVFADFPGKIPNNTVIGNTSGSTAAPRAIPINTIVTGGTVTSVTFTGDGIVLSSTPSSAVTTTGTLTAALATQSANVVLAGRATAGSAIAPTFRSLVSADLPPISCGDLSDDGAGCTAGAASTSVAGIAKLHNVPVAVGWPAGLDPNNVVLATINQASTISAIIGSVETAVGAAATLTVSKAPSGTACSAGTVLHSGSFNANGTAATNQTLTVTTSSLSVGDRICLQTTNSANWVAGTGIGTITVFLSPS